MIGIDQVYIPRMQRFLQKFEKKALQRFLCDEEIKLIKNDTTAAGFWAAKEAFSKALGTGIGKEFSFHDMRIYKDAKGAPKIALSRKIIQNFTLIDVALSISHHGDYAIAVVTVKSSSPTDKIKEF